MSAGDYPITAAELARREGIDGKLLRDVLRDHPELVPGHEWGKHYRIDRQMARDIMGRPDVRSLKHRR